MKCPGCGYLESKVIDSRPVSDNNSIRRRRECLECKKRFTTYEVIDSVQIVVIKKDDTKEFFDRMKLESGLIKACQKRPVDSVAIANAVENTVLNSLKSEITSVEIGELIMSELIKADAVAYIRFVSVYRDFNDVESFMKELKKFL